MTYDHSAQPESKGCRLIDFEEATIHPGILPNTFFLVVKGQKPCINMEVKLWPLVYVDCPEYWEIEVVGCLNGPCLPAAGSYTVTIPLQGNTGYEGIEVVGANKRKKIKVSGGCIKP